jgi:hypothetical protein
VGETVGGEFLAYAHSLDLPDPEEVLAEGTKFVLPSRDDRTLCILENVAYVACKDHTKRAERWNTACDIVANVGKKKKDITISVIQYLMNNKPKDVKIHKVASDYFTTLNELGLLKR